MRFWLVFCLLNGLLLRGLQAQHADSLRQTSSSSADSLLAKPTNKKGKDPRRASLLSAAFPGAGQLYNQKYWKLPIVYGAAFALGYYINLNHSQYVRTRDAYLQVKAGQPDYYNGLYSAEQLVRLREYWRRNRDLLIIVSAFTYLLNIADAAVDAHFSTFDVSDDLSMRPLPYVDLAFNQQPILGLSFTFERKYSPKK